MRKKHRDIVKYGVDVSNGDQHHLQATTRRPEFNIGKYRIRIQNHDHAGLAPESLSAA